MTRASDYRMRLANLEIAICMLAMTERFIVNMTLTDRIKKLRIGKTIFLADKGERITALNIAKILGLRVTTKARKTWGFTMTRLPE